MKTTKGPFIATQLNPTQLDVKFSWVELRRYRHPHRRNSTVADDRQCNWPSWTAYSQSARNRSVELSCVAINTSSTQLNSTRRRVELCRYKRDLTHAKSTKLKPGNLLYHPAYSTSPESHTRQRISCIYVKLVLTSASTWAWRQRGSSDHRTTQQPDVEQRHQTDQTHRAGHDSALSADLRTIHHQQTTHVNRVSVMPFRELGSLVAQFVGSFTWH